MTTIEFTLKGLPKVTNRQNVHWRVKHAESKKWKLATAFECQHAILKHHLNALPFDRAVLTLTRHSSREPDFDGLVSGFKHVIDGIVASTLIRDDKSQTIGQPTYKWEYARPNKSFITVRISLPTHCVATVSDSPTELGDTPLVK